MNRAYTLLSLIPTAYILRIVYGLYLNQNYLQMAFIRDRILRVALFLGSKYFLLLFDKNLKVDITQLFVKYLPDEVFNIEGEKLAPHKSIVYQQRKQLLILKKTINWYWLTIYRNSFQKMN